MLTHRFIRLFTILPLILAVFLSVTASAQTKRDRIRIKGGRSESGEITKVTSLGVTLDKNGESVEVPITNIGSIIFSGEPSELTQARLNAGNGAYDTALKRLGSINRDAVKGAYVEQEIEFWIAYCGGKLALVGEKPIPEAGAALNKFVNENKQSFHFLEANELLGDLLVTVGNYEAAQKKYEELSRAPWPAYKMKSGVLVGQSLLAQDKFSEALEKFQAVVGTADESEEGKEQTLAATLGMGVATAATGKVEDGIKIVEQVILDADPENAKLLAPAYNALGGCYAKAGQPKQALYAYLHVDLLYGRVGEAHAEALYHLAPLWDSIGQEGEARRARQKLAESYPASRWAKM